MMIYPSHEDPREVPTIPAQHATVTEAPAVTVTVQQARTERLEAIIAGMEGALRNIRSRAQKALGEDDPIRILMQLEVIDALAMLALSGEALQQQEAIHDEW